MRDAVGGLLIAGPDDTADTPRAPEAYVSARVLFAAETWHDAQLIPIPGDTNGEKSAAKPWTRER